MRRLVAGSRPVDRATGRSAGSFAWWTQTPVASTPTPTSSGEVRAARVGERREVVGVREVGDPVGDALLGDPRADLPQRALRRRLAPVPHDDDGPRPGVARAAVAPGGAARHYAAPSAALVPSATDALCTATSPVATALRGPRVPRTLPVPQTMP